MCPLWSAISGGVAGSKSPSLTMTASDALSSPLPHFYSKFEVCLEIIAQTQNVLD